MKSRRLMLTLEVQTDIPLKCLRKASNYSLEVNRTDEGSLSVDVIQAEANVVEENCCGQVTLKR